MLPVGIYLGEFEIIRLIGEGGFGIVYLAWDHSLRPQGRAQGIHAGVAGRARRRHASVVGQVGAAPRDLRGRPEELRQRGAAAGPVRPSVAGQGLPLLGGERHRLHGDAVLRGRHAASDALARCGAPPDEAWLRDLLAPLLDALAVLHAAQCFHRDIAPDNVILLTATAGRPLLLDFGAARRVIGDMTQALTVILKPGYAPIEQYADVPGMKQGPWTDVYALAAVVYYAITGKTPPPSVGRLMDDHYVPMRRVGAGRYSPRFLARSTAALAVKPEERTPSIDDLRRDLGMAPSDIDSGKARAPRTRDHGRRPSGRRGAGAQGPEPASSPASVRCCCSSSPAACTSLSRGKPAAPVTATATPPAAVTAAPTVPPTVAPVASAPPVVATTTPTRPRARRSRRRRPGRSIRPRIRARRRGAVGRLQGRGGGRQAAAAHQQGQHDLQGEDREGRLSLRPACTAPTARSSSSFPTSRRRTTRSAPTRRCRCRREREWDISVGGPPGVDHFIAIVSKFPRDFSGLWLEECATALPRRLSTRRARRPRRPGSGGIRLRRPAGLPAAVQRRVRRGAVHGRRNQLTPARPSATPGADR